MNFDDQLNASKAAEFLGVSRPTFYKFIKKYELEPLGKIGNMRVFALEDLQRIKEFRNADK